MQGFIKGIMTTCLGLGVALLTPLAGAVDNSALKQSTFREHKATYGLVYLLPQEVTSILDSKVYPRFHQRLSSLGLKEEADTFNLPHVTVVHIHSADPGTPEKMLKALPGRPSALNLSLKDFSVTFAAKGAEVPWWFDLGVVKQGRGYEEMMSYNTKASAALTPLRDGPAALYGAGVRPHERPCQGIGRWLWGERNQCHPEWQGNHRAQSPQHAGL
jgi:hypothetical protein